MVDLESFQPVSIDINISNDNADENYGNIDGFKNVTSTNNIDDNVEENDKKIIVNGLINGLSEREQFIIRSLYGIGCEEKSLATLSNEVGLTKERVRQIVSRAFDDNRNKQNKNIL